jgi:alpha-L-fucosidase
MKYLLMPTFFLLFLAALSVQAANETDTSTSPFEEIDMPIAPGPCEPTWKSLGDHFQRPTWWRQAKIGIWLFWGPMSVGEAGDWYAKWIYMPKHASGDFSKVYSYHAERFGHPSQFGFKDILPLWKAEKWDPDKLMALYRRAGARYVLAQGQHHDNFDNWNSKYQPWNSVNIGPHRDVVGDWKKAADKHGMRFGIAFHGDYALWWYQPAFLADLEGPLKGVPYDAAQDYEGKDTWWKKMGLDLKDLYGIDLKDEVVYPADFTGDPTEFRMRNPLGHGIPDGNLKKNIEFARWFATKFANRVKDAIDSYSPDFIFFDGAGSFPFCGHFTGRGLRADAVPRVIAHLYNTSMAKYGGRLEAMAFTKGNEDSRAVAVNSESRVFDNIKRDQPWHTENTVGDWVYRTGLFYDTGMVIHQMLESISRDGNYIINLPLTPAGTLDPGGVKTLEEMGSWMDVNGEGIYDSSAWDVWGEGTVVMKGGLLKAEHARTPYTGQDIRFVTKNGIVFAYLMAWPADGKAIIRSLATPAGKVSDVALLGSNQKLDWQQTDDALVVTLPPTKPCQFAYGLKVTGSNLKAAPSRSTTVSAGPAPFSAVGEWDQGTVPGHTASAPAWYSHDPAAAATWRPGLLHSGPVRISFYLVVHPTGVQGASVEVTGAEAPVSANFNLSNGASRWEPVGVARFQGKGEEQITLRGDGRGFLRSSAVRLEILDPKDPNTVIKTLMLDHPQR